jgi:predicted RNase H-like HicB family nuclease
MCFYGSACLCRFNNFFILGERYPEEQLLLISVIYTMMQEHYNIIVEKHPEGYVAYPLGLNGVIVGEGNTYEEALADVHSAIKFHIETFGDEAFQTDSPVLEAYLIEA